MTNETKVTLEDFNFDYNKSWQAKAALPGEEKQLNNQLNAIIAGLKYKLLLGKPFAGMVVYCDKYIPKVNPYSWGIKTVADAWVVNCALINTSTVAQGITLEYSWTYYPYIDLVDASFVAIPLDRPSPDAAEAEEEWSREGGPSALR